VAAAIAVQLLLVGCGSGSGVGEGAKVAVYVSRPLCAEAERTLERRGREVDGVTVGIVCLPAAAKGGRLDLALAGAQARRAIQDSTAVAFVERRGRETTYTRPILEEADVAAVVAGSGATAIGEILDDLDERGAKSPREAVSS
jgi:hypothetical protein